MLVASAQTPIELVSAVKPEMFSMVYFKTLFLVCCKLTGTSKADCSWLVGNTDSSTNKWFGN